MVNRKAYELPSFVSVTVFTTKLRSFAHDPPTERGHCHVGLTRFVTREQGD
jgi:hypothetical protein